MEHRQLNALAMAGLSHDSQASDRLYWELDRARVVPDRELPPGTVCMGSIVTYRTNEGTTHSVHLVYPEQAVHRNRVSILSALGTALIGVTAGDTIPWTSSGGGAGTLTVLSVSGP
jgi:regulator of nucleoside diphosphate kinase